jgi:hypothetical protein
MHCLWTIGLRRAVLPLLPGNERRASLLAKIKCAFLNVLEQKNMRKRFDTLENLARGYAFGKEEDECLGSPFNETPASPYFEEDAITEAVYLAFLEDHDARRKRIPL